MIGVTKCLTNKQGIDCKLTTLMNPTGICVLATTSGKPANAPAQRKWPHRVRYKSASFNPGTNAIQVMTMKVSKGLAFPVVALPGVGHVPAAGSYGAEAARVFDVAATRAKQRLVMAVSGLRKFSERLEK